MERLYRRESRTKEVPIIAFPLHKEAISLVSLRARSIFEIARSHVQFQRNSTVVKNTAISMVNERSHVLTTTPPLPINSSLIPVVLNTANSIPSKVTNNSAPTTTTTTTTTTTKNSKHPKGSQTLKSTVSPVIWDVLQEVRIISSVNPSETSTLSTANCFQLTLVQCAHMLGNAFDQKKISSTAKNYFIEACLSQARCAAVLEEWFYYGVLDRKAWMDFLLSKPDKLIATKCFAVVCFLAILAHYQRHKMRDLSFIHFIENEDCGQIHPTKSLVSPLLENSSNPPTAYSPPPPAFVYSRCSTLIRRTHELFDDDPTSDNASASVPKITYEKHFCIVAKVQSFQNLIFEALKNNRELLSLEFGVAYHLDEFDLATFPLHRRVTKSPPLEQADNSNTAAEQFRFIDMTIRECLPDNFCDIINMNGRRMLPKPLLDEVTLLAFPGNPAMADRETKLAQAWMRKGTAEKNIKSFKTTATTLHIPKKQQSFATASEKQEDMKRLQQRQNSYKDTTTSGSSSVAIDRLSASTNSVHRKRKRTNDDPGTPSSSSKSGKRGKNNTKRRKLSKTSAAVSTDESLADDGVPTLVEGANGMPPPSNHHSNGYYFNNSHGYGVPGPTSELGVPILPLYDDHLLGMNSNSLTEFEQTLMNADSDSPMDLGASGGEEGQSDVLNTPLFNFNELWTPASPSAAAATAIDSNNTGAFIYLLFFFNSSLIAQRFSLLDAEKINPDGTDSSTTSMSSITTANPENKAPVTVCVYCDVPYHHARRHGMCQICSVTCRANRSKKKNDEVRLSQAHYHLNDAKSELFRKFITMTLRWVDPSDEEIEEVLAHFRLYSRTKNVAIETCISCHLAVKYCCGCILNGHVLPRHILFGQMRANNFGNLQIRVNFVCGELCAVNLQEGRKTVVIKDTEGKERVEVKNRDAFHLYEVDMPDVLVRHNIKAVEELENLAQGTPMHQVEENQKEFF